MIFLTSSDSALLGEANCNCNLVSSIVFVRALEVKSVRCFDGRDKMMLFMEFTALGGAGVWSMALGLGCHHFSTAQLFYFFLHAFLLSSFNDDR